MRESWRTSVRLAAREASKGLRSQPRIQTTWASAVRRSFVVVAFIVIGLALGDLALVVGGAFGALQVGYADVGLPFGRLMRYLAVNIVAVGVAVFVSASIGGTWWTMPWLVALALAAGALARGSSVGMTAPFNALVLSIVFSGVALPPGGAVNVTMWVVAGAVAQSVVWLVSWRWARRSHVDLALANDLESIRRMTLRRSEFGVEVAESAGVESALQGALRSARLPEDMTQAAVEVASWAALVRRATITWIDVADPSLQERESLGATLHAAQGLLLGRTRQEWQSPAVSGEFACVKELYATLVGLQGAVERWREHSSPGASSARVTGPAGSLWNPRSLAWRHGIRVAVAVGIAQAVSLPLSSEHSFWIPLTVAFIVKPDWAYTLIRTLLRLVGTVIAVMLLGYTAFWLIDHPVIYVMVSFLLVLVTLRWTSGNYAVAAFAITGFILLIDSTLDRGPDLPVERLAFTLAGSIIGLSVAFLLPAWVSRDVPATVRDVVRSLRDGVEIILPASGASRAADTYVAGLRIRDSLERLRMVAVGTALEPRRRSVSTAALLDLLDRGQIVLVRLWALGTYELMSARNGAGAPVPSEELHRIEESLDRSCRAVGVTDDASPETSHEVTSPLPMAMARAADRGFVVQATPLSPAEVQRVALLATEFERDVVRLGDSARHLGLPST